MPLVSGEEGHLFGSPAAFGTYGEGGVRHTLSRCGGALKAAVRVSGLFGLARAGCGWGWSRLRGRARGVGSAISGMVGAAGLLGGFEGDAAPAFGTFGRGEGEMFFRAAGEDGRDPCYTELGGFFDGPLEVIELEDGEQ